MRPEPKFAPGEPAIVSAKDSDKPELDGIRVIVIETTWSEHYKTWGCKTLPSFSNAPADWVDEIYLRPLPPEELSGCFDSESMPTEGKREAVV